MELNSSTYWGQTTSQIKSNAGFGRQGKTSLVKPSHLKQENKLTYRIETQVKPRLYWWTTVLLALHDKPAPASTYFRNYF